MRKHVKFNMAILAAMVFVFSACNKDKIKYDVPATYSFDNIDISGQVLRQDMLAELSAYVKSANAQVVELDAAVMRDMFENQNNPFTFTADKQLKDKCLLSEQGRIENMFSYLAAASASTVAGSNGTAGIVLSNNGDKQYLFDENGMEWAQRIEKGIMGAVFYYQATAVYLSDSKIGAAVDNETVVDGKGTDMEHHWDEAFGYMGVPFGFPADQNGVRFLGSYINARDAQLGCNARLMEAFILGRAAISNGDMDTKNEQVAIIRDELEKAMAGTVLHYLNDAKANIADDALRNHELSEALAFAEMLPYNPTSRFSAAQVATFAQTLGSNFYEISLAKIDQARNQISDAYGFGDLKDQF